MSGHAVLLLALGLVAAGIVAELGLRWLFRREHFYVHAPGMRELLQLDSETHPQLEKEAHFSINADGERGSPYQAGPGARRVLVVGGSAVECRLLDQSTAWPAVIERGLNTPAALADLGASRVHVGTVAKSSVDTATLDLILRRIAGNYGRLDLVIISVGASDVVRWLELSAPPDRPAEQLSIEACFDRNPERTYHWNPRGLALAEAFRRLRIRRVRVRPKAARWMAKARRMRAGAREIRDILPVPDVMLESFSRNFRSCIQRGLNMSDRVMIVRQPWFEKEVYSEAELASFWNGGAGNSFSKEISVFYSNRVLCRLMGLMDQQAKRIAEEMEIPEVDLMAILPMTMETFFDHFHYTPAGSALVGVAVAATARGLLASAEGRPV